jgi:hypothetical protein
MEVCPRSFIADYCRLIGNLAIVNEGSRRLNGNGNAKRITVNNFLARLWDLVDNQPELKWWIVASCEQSNDQVRGVKLCFCLRVTQSFDRRNFGLSGSRLALTLHVQAEGSGCACRNDYHSIVVWRSGDASRVARVDYATDDGAGWADCGSALSRFSQSRTHAGGLAKSGLKKRVLFLADRTALIDPDGAR